MFTNMIGISGDHLVELLNHINSAEQQQQQQQPTTTTTTANNDDDDNNNHMLIIDCRSFLSYNDSHIIHSINVFCPPFLRRRNGTKPLLKSMFTDGLIRDRLQSDYYLRVILYEDHDLTSDSVAFYIAQCLREEAGIKYINYLEGGFQRFRMRHPLFVTDPPKPISSVKPTTKTKCFNIRPRRTNYHYVHTWPFRSKSNNFFKPSTPVALTFLDDFPRIFFEDQTEPAELLPYLFLGNECHASSKNLLQNLGITAVLNVSQSCPNHFENEFYYKRIPINDSKCDDITLLINEALNFIDMVREDGNGKILVHCRAGISRSATICIAHIIKTKRIRMEEAYEFVKSRRKLISPNFNFMTQLMEFEDQVFSDKKQI